MASTPTTLEILRQWLVANGYDGLWNNDPCGCGVDDLAPCGNVGHCCQAAYCSQLTESDINNDDEYCWYGDDLKVGDWVYHPDRRQGV